MEENKSIEYLETKDELKNFSNMHILIAYGSKYGSTTEIAERIGEILQDEGIKVDRINLNEEKLDSKFSLDKYTGFIIGSGIYAGVWTLKIKKFLKKRCIALNQKPIAAFAVCGEVHNSKNIETARTKYVEKYLKKFGIIPDFGAAFAGVLDLSSNSPYSKLELKIVRMINKKDSNVSLEENNDFRDWEKIIKFSRDFIRLFPHILNNKKNYSNKEISILRNENCD